jgi:prepilin-type N-terminal cleavage/methylation domain-containing protein
MKGFTLVEILVVIIIAVFVSAGIIAIFYVANTNWYLDTGLLDLQQQARLAMDGMTKEIRQSRIANLTVSAGGIDVNFTIPMNLSNPGNTTYSSVIHYYKNNTQIIREYSGSTKILANNINNLSFNVTDETVVIRLSAFKTVLQKPLILNLTEKVRLRNE